MACRRQRWEAALRAQNRSRDAFNGFVHVCLGHRTLDRAIIQFGLPSREQLITASHRAQEWSAAQTMAQTGNPMSRLEMYFRFSWYSETANSMWGIEFLPDFAFAVGSRVSAQSITGTTVRDSCWATSLANFAKRLSTAVLTSLLQGRERKACRGAARIATVGSQSGYEAQNKGHTSNPVLPLCLCGLLGSWDLPCRLEL